MKKLQEELNWYHSHKLKDFEHEKLCQCGTEKVIKKSHDKIRMRNTLLLSIFIDQFLLEFYPAVYDSFQANYKAPKLLGHPTSQPGHPASWLIYSRHGYDQQMDWKLFTQIASDCIQEMEDWLSSQGQDITSLSNLLNLVIMRDFEEQHEEQLRSSFGIGPLKQLE